MSLQRNPAQRPVVSAVQPWEVASCGGFVSGRQPVAPRAGGGGAGWLEAGRAAGRARERPATTRGRVHCPAGLLRGFGAPAPVGNPLIRSAEHARGGYLCCRTTSMTEMFSWGDMYTCVHHLFIDLQPMCKKWSDGDAGRVVGNFQSCL